MKTHVDLISDFGAETIEGITRLAKKYDFLVFEDRNFADIGNTVRQQYGAGAFRIAKWADIVNAHIIPGEGIIEGLKVVGRQQPSPNGRGLLLNVQMSSANSFETIEHTTKVLEMAKKHKDFVVGFVANRPIRDQTRGQHDDFLIFTPGVNFSSREDTLAQRYRTPHEAISRGSDVIIVGRGIYEAHDPIASAKQYQMEGWYAYTKRLRDLSAQGPPR